MERPAIIILILVLGILPVIQAQAYFENANFVITKSEISPVPAEPGRDLLLEVTIKNQGQSEARNVSIEIKPDSPILLKNENERVISKESICASCQLSETYHLYVDPRAVSGAYEIEITATREGEAASTTKTIGVTVRGKPQLTLSNVKINPAIITPDGNFTLDFSLENRGTGMASAVNVKALLDDTPFIPIGTNSQVMEKLEPGSSEKMQYLFLVKKSAVPGGYSLPMTMSYEGENNLNFSSKESVGINVVGEAKPGVANVKTDPNKIVAGNDVTMMITVENTGTGDAKSVKADITGLPFPGTKTAFLGKIEPGDDAPAIFNLQAGGAGNYKYNLTIQYEDDLYGRHEYSQDLNLVVYSRIDGKSSNMALGAIAIAAVGIAYFVYTRRLKRKSL